MFTSPEELRGAIVREAFEWVGTPYQNAGDIKGPQGAVDCAMLLIRVFAAVGAIEYFDPRPYSSNWHLHQDEARYLAGLEKYAHRVDEGKLGDIAMFRFGKHASHGAIIVSDEHVIHAHKNVGEVILCERSAMQERLDSYWSVVT